MDFTYLLRPKTFEKLRGQEHLCSQDAPLRVLTQKGVLGHSFLYGPAGCGKTSLARIVANEMQLPFYEFNATSLKIEQLREIFKRYTNTLQKPLIFIDEVHRLTKTQQEVLLPVMENNSVVIIGASTQNPFFSLTSAIRSRSLLFELYPLTEVALSQIALDALNDADVTYEEDALNYLIKSSGGDARAMLKLLEFALEVEPTLTLKALKALRPNAIQSGSSESSMHYDLTSALIKSMRGSDMDATIYYLARLIEGGESADFIARRFVIFASEDVGNANPNALNIAASCLSSVEKIGFPEARIILSQTALYLTSSPKSNASYLAINKALQSVRDGLILDIPKNIVQQKENYLNPHDFGGYVKQNYLTQPLHFVELKEIGYEKKMKLWSEEIAQIE